MREAYKGSTSHSEYFVITDVSGVAKTGLVYTDMTGSYVRAGGSRTSVTMATLAAANSAWSTGGFKEVDATNQKGLYRWDIPDAAYATGVDNFIATLQSAATNPVHKEFRLTDWNKQIASIPNYAAGAYSGIPIAGSNGGVRLSSQGVIDAGSGVWTSTVTDYSGITNFGGQVQPMYYADVKQYYDVTNTRDEYAITWFCNNKALPSGAVTHAKISAYSTANGAAVFENAVLSPAGYGNPSMRYNEASNVLTAGEPYLTLSSGTIDGTTRVWQKIVGRNKLS